MAFLDAQARAVLFEPPDTHEEALTRYALMPEDVAFARRRRRSHNRLGFAVQLALVRDLGRPLRSGETIPVAVLDTVADQIGIDPVVFELYARRDETRREHLAEIMTRLDLRPMQERDYRLCIRAAAVGAVATEKGEPIALAVIDALKVARIVVPGARLIERLALAGRAMARRQAYRHLITGLGPATLASLDELLSERSGERTLLGWIADAPEGARPKSLKAVIARLEVVRRAGITDERRKMIHANRYGVIAKEARSRAVRFVHDQGTTIPDALLAQVAPLPWSHIAHRRLSMERDRPTPRTLPPHPRQPLQSQELRIPLEPDPKLS